MTDKCKCTPVPLLDGLERMVVLGCDVTSFSRYLLIFLRKQLPPSSTLKIKAAGSSKYLCPSTKVCGVHIPGD